MGASWSLTLLVRVTLPLFVIRLFAAPIRRLPFRNLKASLMLLEGRKATAKYTSEVESSITRHRVIERIGRAHETSTTKQQCKTKLDNIDQQTKEHMRGAEKRCRRIKSGRIPFSPESSRWIRRAQVYRSVLRYHAGKIRNCSNLKRSACRCGILKPL